MAANADIPVINALSDKFIPVRRSPIFHSRGKFGALRGFKLAYVGDGNNVCNSLIYLAARLGVHLRIATPPDYARLPKLWPTVSASLAKRSQDRVDDRSARSCRGAQGVYTDSWTSMGFEEEGEVRNAIFQPYQVNAS